MFETEQVVLTEGHLKRAKLAHAHDPANPSKAICGYTPKGAVQTAGPDAMRCLVCESMARSGNFVDR